MQEKQKINLVWFRNDLRVRDQISLTSALQKDLPVLGVYVFQPKHYEITKYGFKKTEKFRAKFLLQSVENLKDNLHQLNLPLWVAHQEIGKAFEEIYQTFKVEHIFYQTEWTSEEKEEEIRVKKTLSETKFNPQYNQFLFYPEDIPRRAAGPGT
ncbi:MAG: deoxyribodipyrimidine photo-lyase [Psychroflexus maritimus]